MGTSVERRRAERYRINAKVILRRENGEPVSAVLVDISSLGMLVQLDGPTPFGTGEELTVEVKLSDQHSDKPLSHWGIARVVRLDGECLAMQLCAGDFYDRMEEQEDD